MSIIQGHGQTFQEKNFNEIRGNKNIFKRSPTQGFYLYAINKTVSGGQKDMLLMILITKCYSKAK